MRELLFALAAINAIAALVTAADKFCARHDMWRVPERVLWTLAVCGGAAGMLLTMRLVRHKTKHRRFMVGLPVTIAIQAVVIALLLAGGKIPM